MRREPQMTGSGPGRRLRRLAVAAAAAVLLAAVGQAAAAAPVQAGVSRTSITVDRAHPFSRLPADFVGLSYEMRELASWCTTGDCTGNFDARTGNLVALYKNLGKSNVRIGGNQLDRDTLWLPAGQQAPNPLPDWVKDIVTPADIARFDQRLRASSAAKSASTWPTMTPTSPPTRPATSSPSSARACPAPRAATSPIITPVTTTGPRRTAISNTNATGRPAPTW